MLDIDNTVDKVTQLADDSFESGEERQKTLTERLRIDTTSPFMLAHIVRPIIALTLLAMQIVLLVAMFLGIEIPDNVIIEVGSLLGIAIGFYFNSRKAEKINAKKVQAAIEIQESKQKIEEIKERALVKETRKQNRKDRRNQ